MKKKYYVLIAAVMLMVLIGMAGKNYADNIINWGGENNITKINENLDKLSTTLSTKEQQIT